MLDSRLPGCGRRRWTIRSWQDGSSHVALPRCRSALPARRQAQEDRAHAVDQVSRVSLLSAWERAESYTQATTAGLTIAHFCLFRSLKRTVTDSIFRPVPFCDVILADILTSFARVLADFWVCICIVLFITHGEDDPLVEQYRNLGVPIITALPYLFRFRQCIAEYFTAPLISPSLPAVISTATSTLQVPGNGHAASSHGHHHHQPSIFVAPASASSTPASPRTRALFNALKYSTAFPVILFSALQNGRDPYNHPEEPTTLLGRGLTAAPAWFSSMTLFRLWLFSVLINSLYSFWWDVTNDWGLHLLSPTFKSTFPYLEAPKGGTWLRRTMLLPDNSAYVAVVLLDLVLRFTWSLKLSPHLHSIHEIDLGIFMLQALEVLRRWIWVYGRIEWEAVRKGGDALEERMRLDRKSVV